MQYIQSIISEKTNFFGKSNPVELAKKYGTPVFIYNELILRDHCREMKNLVKYPNFSVNFSPKANSNLTILKIVREEGLLTDAMSPGEIFVNLKAGFMPEQIFYISNNVCEDEMKYAINAGVTISVDSVSQLAMYGRLNPGGKIAIRLNPGVGAGHHAKVVTGGKETKFGIEMILLPEVKKTLKNYNLTLTGINQHIGSLFMTGALYLESLVNILDIAKQFNDLEFIDLGGGFGIPYHKQDNEKRLDLKELGERLDETFGLWTKDYGKEITFKIEPGRYIVAESGIILGKVNSVKTNYNIKYIGSDIGFNVLIRPVLYDSHHDVEIYRESDTPSSRHEQVRIVGNICESGDIIIKDRLLPEIFEKDIIGILDSGAYAFSMSSNYNNRLRPAEVLVDKDGGNRLIRRRDNLEDLIRNFEEI